VPEPILNTVSFTHNINNAIQKIIYQDSAGEMKKKKHERKQFSALRAKRLLF